MLSIKLHQQKNLWIKHFNFLEENVIENWVDFEREILIVIDSPNHLFKNPDLISSGAEEIITCKVLDSPILSNENGYYGKNDISMKIQQLLDELEELSFAELNPEPRKLIVDRLSLN